MTETNTSSPAVRLGHVPALDGVRGLAILMVMFFHWTVLWKDCKLDALYGAATRFGWAGVDLFFVLSGFLITGILLDSRDQPNYLRNFYVRRVLRIFPLYYIVVIIGTIILPLLPLTHSREFFPTVEPSHLPFYWLYFSNFPIVFGATDHMNDLLAITWSLAIEEQFYMIWPLVVLWCRPSTLVKTCIGLVGASLAFRTAIAIYFQIKGGSEYAFEHHRILYEFTLSRMDAIALGSLLATMMRTGGIEKVRSLKPRTYVMAAISILVILGCFAFHKQTIFNRGGPGQTIGYTAIAVLFFCVLLWTITSPADGLFNRFFTQRWLIFLGTYSYAIYLCHMPIHRIMREYVYRPADFWMIAGSKMPGQIIFYVLCAVPSIVIALLSWHLIEKHFLKLKKHFPSKHPPEITPTPAGVSQAQQSAAG